MAFGLFDTDLEDLGKGSNTPQFRYKLIRW